MNEQEEIATFIKKAIGDKRRISYEKYKKINTDHSSEMVLSMLSLFHDNLPCSGSVFRMKDSFMQLRAKHIPEEEEKKGATQRKSSFLASPNIMKNFIQNAHYENKDSSGGVSQNSGGSLMNVNQAHAKEKHAFERLMP